MSKTAKSFKTKDGVRKPPNPNGGKYSIGTSKSNSRTQPGPVPPTTNGQAQV